MAKTFVSHTSSNFLLMISTDSYMVHATPPKAAFIKVTNETHVVQTNGHYLSSSNLPSKSTGYSWLHWHHMLPVFLPHLVLSPTSLSFTGFSSSTLPMRGLLGTQSWVLPSLHTSSCMFDFICFLISKWWLQKVYLYSRPFLCTPDFALSYWEPSLYLDCSDNANKTFLTSSKTCSCCPCFLHPLYCAVAYLSFLVFLLLSNSYLIYQSPIKFTTKIYL